MIGAHRSSSFGEAGDGGAHAHDESHTEEVRPRTFPTVTGRHSCLDSPSAACVCKQVGDGEALVDVRPYLERGASEGRAYFPARRLVPHSGHLSHCVLVVTNNTILQARAPVPVGGGAARHTVDVQVHVECLEVMARLG